jgi:hypothetical protein
VRSTDSFWFSLLPISQTDPQWIGLCGAYCRVRNWPLCTESLEVASHFLHSICVQRSLGESPGATAELRADEWFMFALKEQEVLRHGFGRMHADTRLQFMNCQPSLPTHRTS